VNKIASAFDPIFFLHHCNIDRLVSIWSAINGGKGVSAGKNDGDGTFTLAPWADLNEDTGNRTLVFPSEQYCLTIKQALLPSGARITRSGLPDYYLTRKNLGILIPILDVAIIARTHMKMCRWR